MTINLVAHIFLYVSMTNQVKACSIFYQNGPHQRGISYLKCYIVDCIPILKNDLQAVFTQCLPWFKFISQDRNYQQVRAETVSCLLKSILYFVLAHKTLFFSCEEAKCSGKVGLSPRTLIMKQDQLQQFTITPYPLNRKTRRVVDDVALKLILSSYNFTSSLFFNPA